MLEITLPYPPKELMPNRANGKHWAQTSKLKAESKMTAFLLTKSALATRVGALGWTMVTNPPAQDVPMTITFVRSDQHRVDADNLLAASKAALDGVAQALGLDDSFFEPITIKRIFVKGESSTIVEVG